MEKTLIINISKCYNINMIDTDDYHIRISLYKGHAAFIHSPMEFFTKNELLFQNSESKSRIQKQLIKKTNTSHLKTSTILKNSDPIIFRKKKASTVKSFTTSRTAWKTRTKTTYYSSSNWLNLNCPVKIQSQTRTPRDSRGNRYKPN